MYSRIKNWLINVVIVLVTSDERIEIYNSYEYALLTPFFYERVKL